MITLLLGTDGLAKKQHIFEAIKKAGAEIESYNEGSTLPPLGTLFEQQLFGAPKVVVFDEVKALDLEDVLEKLGDNKNAQLYILEQSLDKRKKVNLDFLKDSRVNVLEFSAPVGVKNSANWILKFAKNRGIEMDTQTATELATTLLVDEEDNLPVERAQNELEKLKAYAGGDVITAEMVHLLVEPITGVDVFALLNAISEKNKSKALKLLNEIFSLESGDEKGNAIKIVALLADQFRSLLMVQDSLARKFSDEQIMELTGWKTGRLFIMKKLARNFTPAQAKSALSKLTSLDKELKSSTLPSKVVLSLIVAGL